MEIKVSSDLEKAAKDFTDAAAAFADKMSQDMVETLDQSTSEFQSDWRTPITSQVASSGDETTGVMTFTRLVHTHPLHPRAKSTGIKVAFVRRPPNPDYRPVEDQVNYSSDLLKTKLAGGA